MSIRKIAIIAIIVTALAREKLYFYFVRGWERGYARAALFKTSFRIAKDYFPFGTGWGTFGSYYALTHYSPVYYLYGISDHWELGVQTKLFLNDTYWPVVIAESGWIGSIAIAAVFVVLYLEIRKLYKANYKMYAAGLMALLYIGITTVEETGFMQPVLLCLAIILGMINGYGVKRGKNKSEGDIIS